MSSIIKTFLTLTAGASLTTGAVIIKKHPEFIGLPKLHQSQPISPLVINENGTVRFLGRIPPATIAAEIRSAAHSQNTKLLNSQLIKYHFYAIPEDMAFPIKP